MKVAVTGATGFIGHYIVGHLTEHGHSCKCWYGLRSQRSGLEEHRDLIEWVTGELCDPRATHELVAGTDAVVHSALFRPGPGFRGAEGDIVEFTRRNVLGALMLIEAARQANVPRFVLLSTCAVHEIILEDRALDEAHPMWPLSHYGAHKAALEAFVYSYGLGQGYDICALRPSGVFGLHHDAPKSKWYRLIKALASGDTSLVTERGGKEVHAADVARAVDILLHADGVAGQAYNCYDRYISEQEVAAVTARLTGQNLDIQRSNPGPKHQIDTAKIQALGMRFGGPELLEETVREILSAQKPPSLLGG